MAILKTDGIVTDEDKPQSPTNDMSQLDSTEERQVKEDYVQLDIFAYLVRLSNNHTPTRKGEFHAPE